jgi:hypothetical protein
VCAFRETEFIYTTILIVRGVMGALDYPPTAGEFDAGQPVVRAILGGTGKYMGARGQLTSTRNPDGSYTQVFTLLK